MNPEYFASVICIMSAAKVALFMAELMFCDFPRNLGQRRIGSCVFSILLNAAIVGWACAVMKVLTL